MHQEANDASRLPWRYLAGMQVSMRIGAMVHAISHLRNLLPRFPIDVILGYKAFGMDATDWIGTAF